MTSESSASAAVLFAAAARRHRAGEWVEAIGDYQKALHFDPQLTAARRAIGDVLERLLADVHAGGGAAAKLLFVLAVENLGTIPHGVNLRAPLIAALTEPWGRPDTLVNVTKAVLRTNPAILGAIKRARAGWPQRLGAAQLFDAGDAAPVTSDALLRCLLQATRIADIGFERLLTSVRGVLLDAASADQGNARTSADADALEFAVALAQQCYLNDYAYAVADDEHARAAALRERLVSALRAGAPVAPTWVAAVASYLPLDAVPDAERLLTREWPAPLAEVLAQQLMQPAVERRLRATLPRLTPVDDRVSLDVQRQYEENPYPKWVRLPLLDRPTTLDEYLSALFPQQAFEKIGKPEAEILIAGCGTGQQALDAANLFAASRLLAIDLSLPSLAFAQRKARELGIDNIEFAQADILKLGTLSRRFESIESSGVLHHLADPWAGWKVLLGLLAPGGVMRVGLYSELGRQDVVRGRELVAARGDRATPDGIRRARQELIALANAEALWFVRDSQDFFSISECRDLLFHVQEQRTTLPEIQAFLAAHGLRFLGFELGSAQWQAYGARFPEDATRSDLERWHRFETENPRAFAGMYQFWVQKPRS